MLWVAQGHVCTEDLGSSYIEQLVDRWLMEISEVDFYGKVRSCKMHSLFYEVAASQMLDTPWRTVPRLTSRALPAIVNPRVSEDAAEAFKEQQ